MKLARIEIALSAMFVASLALAACSSDDSNESVGASDSDVGTDQNELLRRGNCVYAGQSYAQGTGFPSSDGCNVCSCSPRGVICTKRACRIDAGAPDTFVPPPVCIYDGATRSEGESFPSSDGCNTCSCVGGGVMCTKRACFIDASASGCTYDGGIKLEGETFPSTDGCNTCSCTAGGAIACTNRACPPDAGDGCVYGGRTYVPGEGFPSTDGCNVCSCGVGGRVMCTKRACIAP